MYMYKLSRTQDVYPNYNPYVDFTRYRCLKKICVGKIDILVILSWKYLFMIHL